MDIESLLGRRVISQSNHTTMSEFRTMPQSDLSLVASRHLGCKKSAILNKYFLNFVTISVVLFLLKYLFKTDPYEKT